MSVTLREKPISKGRVSLYLDIYHNGERWFHFPKIYVKANRPTDEDREKRAYAEQIKIKFENDLIVNENGLINKKAKGRDFITWYETEYITGKKYNPRLHSAIQNVKLFAGAKETKVLTINKIGRKYWSPKIEGNRPISFNRIDEEWCKRLRDFLLTRVSKNTTIDYLDAISASLKKAAKKKFIPCNPFTLLEKSDKVKREEIFRNPFTIEQLQMLADTDIKIHPQIRQAVFFASFSGLRWSDFNCLKWTEVVKHGGEWYLYFDQQKTGGVVFLPLSGQAVDVIEARKKEMKETGNTSPYVFPELVEIEGKKTKYNWFLYHLKRWGKGVLKQFGHECGITGKMMGTHNCRRAFGTNALEASAEGDLNTVSELLGHKSLRAIKSYVKARDKRKLKAVQALPKIEMRIVHNKAA